MILGEVWISTICVHCSMVYTQGWNILDWSVRKFDNIRCGDDWIKGWIEILHKSMRQIFLKVKKLEVLLHTDTGIRIFAIGLGVANINSHEFGLGENGEGEFRETLTIDKWKWLNSRVCRYFGGTTMSL